MKGSTVYVWIHIIIIAYVLQLTPGVTLMPTSRPISFSEPAPKLLKLEPDIPAAIPTPLPPTIPAPVPPVLQPTVSPVPPPPQPPIADPTLVPPTAVVATLPTPQVPVQPVPPPEAPSSVVQAMAALPAPVAPPMMVPSITAMPAQTMFYNPGRVIMYRLYIKPSLVRNKHWMLVVIIFGDLVFIKWPFFGDFFIQILFCFFKMIGLLIIYFMFVSLKGW